MPTPSRTETATAITDTIACPSPGGRTMFLVDLRGGLMLMNEARCRTVERMFGVQRDQVNMTTVIALLVAAEATRRRSQRYKPSRRPNLADWAIGAGALRESIYGVAGPASRDTPLVGTLIAFAILGGLARAPVTRSAQAVKASVRRAHQASLGPYGQLVGRNRRG